MAMGMRSLQWAVISPILGVYMTWQATCGNGLVIGMVVTIMPVAQARIPQGVLLGCTEFIVGECGTIT